MKWSDNYMKAIADFSSALAASREQWKIPQFWRSDPWMAFINANPGAMQFAIAHQHQMKYELSWNQCCNAVSQFITGQQPMVNFPDDQNSQAPTP